jgi:SOS response associated peptidase (SRAP)
MCGRYRRTTSEEELARRYHITIPPQRDLPISWNIAPTQDILAVRLNPETKQRTLDTLRWGLIPNWARDPKIAYKRVETVDTAPAREPKIALTGNVRQPAGFRLPNSHSAVSRLGVVCVAASLNIPEKKLISI